MWIKHQLQLGKAGVKYLAISLINLAIQNLKKFKRLRHD